MYRMRTPTIRMPKSLRTPKSLSLFNDILTPPYPSLVTSNTLFPYTSDTSSLQTTQYPQQYPQYLQPQQPQFPQQQLQQLQQQPQQLQQLQQQPQQLHQQPQQLQQIQQLQYPQPQQLQQLQYPQHQQLQQPQQLQTDLLSIDQNNQPQLHNYQLQGPIEVQWVPLGDSNGYGVVENVVESVVERSSIVGWCGEIVLSNKDQSTFLTCPTFIYIRDRHNLQYIDVCITGVGEAKIDVLANDVIIGSSQRDMASVITTISTFQPILDEKAIIFVRVLPTSEDDITLLNVAVTM